jgi:hypothetical protein
VAYWALAGAGFLLRALNDPALDIADELTARIGWGAYPTVGAVTRAEMRAGLDLLPTWALEQKAAANRQVIAVMRQRFHDGLCSVKA